MREEIYITKSFEETQKIGREFAARIILVQGLSLSGVVALYGDLGSGKTTFVQGMAKGLSITKRLISPTFTIIRIYKFKVQNAKCKVIVQSSKFLYHIDLYRVQSKQDIEGLGIKEILGDPRNIVAIEWAEKMGSLLPKDRWEVRFEDLGEEKRKITISNLY